MSERIAVFGGLYSNYLALGEAIRDARRRGATSLYCLGDLGAFGPFPDRVFPLLHEHRVQGVQGNYDNSIGNGLADCQCGYADPRDNHFARLSYDYTFRRTSPANRDWLRSLPSQLRVRLGRHRLLMCHGSPRRTNEFLWESTTSTAFLDHLADAHDADVILATHTGLKWQRPLSRGRWFVNVGVLGRPENDGRTNVWYAMLDDEPRSLSGRDQDRSSTQGRGPVFAPKGQPEEAQGNALGTRAAEGKPSLLTSSLALKGRDGPAHLAPSGLQEEEESARSPRSPQGDALGFSTLPLRGENTLVPPLGEQPLNVEFVPVHYDHERLAREMRGERLPEEFVETVLSGWWTTCLEILPAKERRRGRF